MGFEMRSEGMCLSIQCGIAKDAEFYGVDSCTKNFYVACEKGNAFNTLNCLDMQESARKLLQQLVEYLVFQRCLV